MSRFTETWTAADGSAWNTANWTTSAPTGGGSDVQSTAGRQVSGTTVSQGPNARYAVKTDITDFAVLVSTIVVSTLTQYTTIQFRGDTPTANRSSPANGYVLYFQAGSGNLQFFRLASGTPTGLNSATINLSGSATYWTRLLVVGSTFYAKAWSPAVGEPTGWDVTQTDTTYTSGYFGLGLEDASASASVAGWDDLTLDYPPAAAPALYLDRYYQQS
jgi:hypothetical protein